jgi:hypothetical protein
MKPPPLLAISLLLLSCAHASSTLQENRDYGYHRSSLRDKVWVRGPWEAIHPSKDVDMVIDQLCPAVMRLERATWGDHGAEYCGVIYMLLSDNNYYASVPSPLAAPNRPSASHRPSYKTCLIPTSVRDPRGALIGKADYHSHPWRFSEISDNDMSEETQWYSIRIQFDGSCRTYKYLHHPGEARPGELYERREKTWVLVGHVRDKVSGKLYRINEKVNEAHDD